MGQESPVEAPREYRLEGKRPPDRGLILVNTGDGKGKSTAALGTALRAAGSGLEVLILQFMKGSWKYGEQEALEKLGIELLVKGEGFTWQTKDREKDEAAARDAFETARELLESDRYDLVILDEINYVMGYGFLPTSEVVHLLASHKARKAKTHIILTGGNAPDEIIQLADTVTNMVKVKHAFDAGFLGVKGLEF